MNKSLSRFFIIDVITLFCILFFLYAGTLGFKYWWPCAAISGPLGIGLNFWLRGRSHKRGTLEK